MKKYLNIFKNINLEFKIFVVYSFYLALSFITFISIYFTESFYKIVYLIFSFFILYLALEIYHSFELKKQRTYFILTALIFPIIYLINKNGNIIFGIAGNILGLYFFATNLFIISISALAASFLKISLKYKYLFILLFGFVLSFLFIFDSIYKFYSKSEFVISSTSDVPRKPEKLNGKLLVSIPDFNALSSIKLNPFYPDTIIGSDEGCGCSYWQTSDENEKDFRRQNIKTDLIYKFDEYAFTKKDYVKLILKNNDKTIVLSLEDDKADKEITDIKATISGGYVRPNIFERGNGLQKDYYKRSLNLFVHENIFIYTYQIVYDLFFKDANKKEVVKVLEAGVEKLIDIK